LLLYSLTLLWQAFLLARRLLLTGDHTQRAAHIQLDINPTCRRQFVTHRWERLYARKR
jgi:hypothetical protein